MQHLGERDETSKMIPKELPMNRRTVLSALIAGITVFASTFVHADALDDILKNKTLRVAVPQDFPPFGSVGIDLKPVGYDIDMAKLIANQLGVVVEIVPV